MFENIVALITPFTEHNLIDFDAMINMIDNLIESGIDGVVVLGSTGECSSISDDERNLIYQFTTKYINGRLKVYLGVGSNSYEKTLKYLKMAENTKCDGVLIVTPYYVCPNQKGLIKYFESILENTKLNVLLYNVKRRCGVELEPKSVEKLMLKYSNIIGLKQAGGRYKDYLYLKEIQSNFKLYSGDDELLEEAYELNLDGIISVIGNGFPCELVDYYETRNEEWVDEICSLIYRYPSPCGIKALLELKGVCLRNVRLPLVPLNDEEMHEISPALK